MACGCGCDKNKNNDEFFTTSGGGGGGQSQGGQESEDQEFTIAGFNIWLVLLFIGAAFTILNWDPKKK